MVRALLALALLATLVACGSEDMDAHLNDLPLKGAAECLSTDQVGSSPFLVRVNLDGSDDPLPVHYSGDDGRCARVLFARMAGDRYGVELDGDLPLDSTAAIAVPGRGTELLLVRQNHPRGGFQIRLFGYAGGRFAELEVDGNPVLPFVATDVPAPISARCALRGFEVSTAVAHQPIGIVPAWDVFTTSYTLDGVKATASAPVEVADNVLDGQLARRYPDLVQHRMLENCRVSRGG